MLAKMWILVAPLIAAAAGAPAAMFDDDGRQSPGLPSRLARIRPAPDFQLQDHLRKEFRMDQLKDKVVLVSFIFTTCNGTCPATTHRMTLVRRELEDRGLLGDARVQFLSITLDPERDTADALRRYMQLYEITDDHWRFLTGKPDQVRQVVDAWGMWARPAANGQLDHPSRIFLVDRTNGIREIYNLSFMKPDWVADDVQLLLDERPSRPSAGAAD